MTWQIFKRLFWKVWREDWLKWASVVITAPIGCWLCLATGNGDWARGAALIYLSAFSAMFAFFSSTRAAKDRLIVSRDYTAGKSGTWSVCFPSLAATVLLSLAAGTWCAGWVVKPSDMRAEHIVLVSVIFFPLVAVSAYQLGIWIDRWAVVLVGTVSAWPIGTLMSLYEEIRGTEDDFTPILNNALRWLSISWVACIILSLVTITFIRYANKHIQRSLSAVLIAVIGLCLYVIFLANHEDYSGYTEISTINSQDGSLSFYNDYNKPWTLLDRRTDREYKAPITGDIQPIDMDASGHVWFINYIENRIYVKCWAPYTAKVETLAKLDKARFVGEGKYPYDCLISSDKKYLLIRQKARLANGYDYISYNIATKQTRVILPNEDRSLTMQALSSSDCAVYDYRGRSYRIMNLRTGTVQLSREISNQGELR